MQVRTATHDDLDFVVDSALNLAFETEDKTLDRPTVVKGVQDCIDNPKLGCYFVCFRESDPTKPVGTLLVTYESSVQVGGMIHMIQSVYVIAEARRQGCFRAMYNHVVETAKADPRVVCVRLYVETENERAQKTYSSLGMH